MLPKVSYFDLAAEKLRQAMGPSASGVDRMRLIHEALSLYHLHQGDDPDPADELELPVESERRPDAAFSRA